VQLGLPFEASATIVASEVYFVRHRRARRYVLRVDPDGRVRVTIPRGGSKREATAFAERQASGSRGSARGSRQPACRPNRATR
jgi:hypothetical protein